MTKRAIFIGRWSPFHNGHLAIMQKKIDEGKPLLILIRDTHYDLYPPLLRRRMIETTMNKMNIDAKVMIIDDIDSVNYGRGVGYEVNDVEVPENIKQISATEIRDKISKGDNSWRSYMPSGADDVLEKYLKQTGIVVWFTGLPKSGKKTIANLVMDGLSETGIKSERIDGSVLRNTISKDLGFSKDDRLKNIERAGFIAKLLSRNGAVVLSTFVTPYKKLRQRIRKEIETDARFIEIFVKTDIKECRKRDIKGIYKKADSGEIEYFSGVSDKYEEPKNPDIILETENKTAEESADDVIKYIESII